MPTHNIHHRVLPDHHARPSNPATRPGAHPASSQLPRQPHPARRRAARSRTSPLTARLLVANTQRKPSNLSAEPPKSRPPTASVPFPPCLPQNTSIHTTTAAQPFPLLIPPPPRASPDYHQSLTPRATHAYLPMRLHRQSHPIPLDSSIATTPPISPPAPPHAFSTHHAPPATRPERARSYTSRQNARGGCIPGQTASRDGLCGSRGDAEGLEPRPNSNAL